MNHAPMKTAVVVLSDPKSGTEESLGRLFNALTAAHEAQEQGDALTILFQGTGTRWLPLLDAADHPAHELFETVKAHVAGASCGCADVFGATADVERAGYALINDHAVPGTRGVPSLRTLAADGYAILTF